MQVKRWFLWMGVFGAFGVAGWLASPLHSWFHGYLAPAAHAKPEEAMAKLPATPAGAEVAIFAGGCFWCMQPPFAKAKGVLATSVGYTGGKEKNPTYKQVSYGLTSHTEAIYIVFDPKKISYEKLLGIFWRNIDPTAENRQFADVGMQYRTGIFYTSESQKKAAEASKAALAKSGCFREPIVVPILKATTFYPAEIYHQDYYLKNPSHYQRYREGSGRAGYLRKRWAMEACRAVRE
jgi:methionine-S-sulfoxide reductase